MRGVVGSTKFALAIVSAAYVLWLAACGGLRPVGPEERFSWEPGSVLTWPVAGTIVSPFGASSRPNHKGIDLACRPGSLVVAAASGTISFAGRIPGYGNVVAITHGKELTTVYAQLGETGVHEGQRVPQAAEIARVGESGYIHYEIRRAKEAVDPATFYALAPKPQPGGTARPPGLSNDTEPGEVPIGEGTTGVASTEPPPVPIAPTPMPAPQARPTPPARVAAAPKRPTPPARVAVAPKPPTPAPPPRETPLPKPPEVVERPAEKPPPAAEGAAATGTLGTTGEAPPAVGAASSGEGTSIGEGAGVVVSNLFYIPAKLAYASAGAVTGGLVLILARDTSAAGEVWSNTMGGDYLITTGHLRGETPIRFMGSSSATPTPASSSVTASPLPRDG